MDVYIEEGPSIGTEMSESIIIVIIWKILVNTNHSYYIIACGI